MQSLRNPALHLLSLSFWEFPPAKCGECRILAEYWAGGIASYAQLSGNENRTGLSTYPVHTLDSGFWGASSTMQLLVFGNVRGSGSV